MIWTRINLPIHSKVIKSWRSGDAFLLNGIIYTARDKAHQRLAKMIESGQKIPLDLKNSFLYYVGPTPAPPGKVIGAAGPTTSSRLDPFSKMVLALGVKGLIGKGKRNSETKNLLKQYQAVYLATFGGAGAYLHKKIKGSSIVAFKDFGPEAIYRLEVEDFPVVVINDIWGGDFYEDQISERR